MKLKHLLFVFSIIAVFYLSSQNATAECLYAYPPGPLQDQVSIFDCIGSTDSICDSSCGAWTEGCEGSKIKIKVISQCYPAIPLSTCVLIDKGNHIQVGVRYTYKDCLTDPVNKICYNGNCVECLSDADCSLSKPKCNLETNTCETPICTVCTEDGTPKDACSTVPANIGKKCLDVGGICSLYTDVSCAPPPSECTFKNDPVQDDAACPDDCTGGCTLNKNVCNSAGNCVKASSSYCGAGNSCASSTSCYTSSGDCGGSAGGCAWWSSTFSVCSSGCPGSYPDKQSVCCESIGYSECNGRPACTSYNPLKGQTPCCTADGGGKKF
ncbi:Uncharacterised protein [uncultured archaeon]|nr:Uncharacterised protein [uncultured archaeon]